MNTTTARTALRTSAVAGLAALAISFAFSAPASAQFASPTAPPPTDHARTAPGLPAEKVAKILAQNEQLKALDAKFDSLVGKADAGSYVEDGQLVVLTTTEQAAAAVRQQGGEARVVENSENRLNSIVESLDAWTAQHSAGTIQSWGIDTARNVVTVTATRGAHDAAATAFLGKVARFGDDVVVATASAQVSPTTTDGAYGGLEYGHTMTAKGYSVCSFGFNALDSAGRYVNVTAGHCLQTWPSLFRYVGSTPYTIGSTRSVNFPGSDYGVFNNSYPSYWTPVAAVANYAGGSINVAGSWGNPPVGATVCKSGRTTGWTCGTITALNKTVNYAGKIVYGLVQHNACVEGGDSGGANMSSGGFAIGLTSGAALNATTGKCLSKQGAANVSYYQPIAPALIANNLRLLVAR